MRFVTSIRHNVDLRRSRSIFNHLCWRGRQTQPRLCCNSNSACDNMRATQQRRRKQLWFYDGTIPPAFGGEWIVIGRTQMMTYHSCRPSFKTTTTTSAFASDGQEQHEVVDIDVSTNETTTTIDTHATAAKSLFLHVGPSGDVWTGDSIFAAKHLQPDYVKSVSLEGEVQVMVENEGSLLVELLEDRLDWTQQIYDTGRLPTELRQYFIDLPPKK